MAKIILKGIPVMMEPTFSVVQAKVYFKNLLKDSLKDHEYERPEWLLPAPAPMFKDNLGCLGVNGLKRILLKKSDSSSPGFDRLPYSVYRHLPCLQSAVCHIINSAINSCKFPSRWKTGDISLLYKKGECSNPKNFRTIALTPSISKIMTTHLTNFANKHMTSNNYWKSAQKGFKDGVSGCIEHQFFLDQMIEKTSAKKEMILVMTDLANAFGSIKHSLILFALKFYQFPDNFIKLVKSQYENLKFRLKLNRKSITIEQEIGVFQGDVLSPILFNIVMNLILEPFESKELVQLGVTVDMNTRRNTMAFADDLDIMGRTAAAAQSLVDKLSIYFKWTRCLKAEPSKFGAIRYKKENSVLVTSDPNLKFEDSIIPFVVGNNEHKFRVLGKYYSISGDWEPIIEFVTSNIQDQLDRLDRSPVSNSLKLMIMKLAFASLNRWNLTVHSTPISYVKRDITTIVNSKLKKWSGLHQSGSLDVLLLPKKSGGLQLPNITHLYKESQIQKFMILKESKDKAIEKLYTKREELKNSSTANNPHWDASQEIRKYVSLLEKDHKTFKTNQSKSRAVVKLAKEAWIFEDSERLRALTKGGALYRNVNENPELVRVIPWTTMIRNMPRSLLAFGVNALCDTNPTPRNLVRWYNSGKLTAPKVVVDASCVLCGHKNCTLGHILNYCPYSLGKDIIATKLPNRMLWRHDQVLLQIMTTIVSANLEWTIYCDISDSPFYYETFDIAQVTTKLRPDVILINERKKEVIIGELSVPLESAMESRHKEKAKKYVDIGTEFQSLGFNAKICAFEISSRGVVSSSLNTFLFEAGLSKKRREETINQVSLKALKCSSQLFYARHSKQWLSSYDT